MIAVEISEIIEQEIAGKWSLSNWHGVNLKRCLVEPVKQFYENTAPSKKPVELWLVLEETPEDKSGYKIVFDETNGLFGLAICGQKKDVFLGYYGTFLETLEGM